MKRKGLIRSMLVSLIVLMQLLFVAPVFAKEDTSLQDIKDKGTLIIGTSADYPPYEFHTIIDGKDTIVGMDVKIAEQIAKDLGVKLEFRDMDFDGLLAALETGKVDIIMAGMNPTPERQNSVDFSDIYYTGGQFLLVRKEDEGKYQNLDDLAGRKIGVQKSTMQEAAAKEQIKEPNIQGLAKVTDLVLALTTKKVDAVVLEEPSALEYAKSNSDVLAVDPGFQLDVAQQGSAIAVKKGSPSLIAAINDTLATIKAENKIADYLSEVDQYTETPAADGEKQAATPLINYWQYYLTGTGNTVLIAGVSVIFGSILGFFLALMRLSPRKLIRIPASAYVEFVRGTPMMIQVMFIYFGLGYIVNIPAMIAGIIAVSLNSGAYVCEIVRSGINAVEQGQVEAARSLGMTQKTAMRYIIFPQALKNIWPALGNEFISVIKESSVVSIIGVSDLIFQTSVVRGITYQAIAPIAVTMVIYFILTFSLTKLLNFYERKLNHA
ncbi:ABC transporter substrate-binding protein/permease [Isobaculum melis]|uniref:Amino acid ABC transporter substrate-binding protein, PAAT family /amino acid ABC transporter membrane protein, PAAT family n=1 Tax=Isobaculum melis TaxID=142588 RepID=A0A1H9UA24_9LACT|nr:ABC transporter substrate-binding protein/permease [Isobaculum melis]SES06111.1 amino acid ABC transporter substrate-binding protein, PAAT family /amino acid ABC transporter membrane protein, PAAT family [Isobaculum melis]